MKRLTKNFRARSRTMSRIQGLGDALRTPGETEVSDGAAVEIAGALLSLHRYGTQPAFNMVAGMARDNGSAAVLCRYNGQALVVSRALHEAGIDHRLKGEAPDRWIGVWLARAFRGYPFTSISPGRFADQIAGSDPPGGTEQAWRALKRAERRSHPDLHLTALVAAMRGRRLPDELTTDGHKPITVSTVHRAKGLEWELVFLYGIGLDDGDAGDSISLAYVAMTRAREEVYILEQPTIWGLANRDQPDGRWMRRVKGLLVDIEVLPDDAQWAAPAGLGVVKFDPAQAQDYLERHVHTGDRVSLSLVRSRLDGDRRAVYQIDHHGHQIGETTSLFSDALLRGMSGKTGAFPVRIDGARVRAIETVGGSSAAGIRAGLGASGMWLRPRLEGLAAVVWGDRA